MSRKIKREPAIGLVKEQTQYRNIRYPQCRMITYRRCYDEEGEPFWEVAWIFKDGSHHFSTVAEDSIRMTMMEEK